MARYRTVDIRIHSDEKYRNLTKPEPCGQYLFLYLLIGPHTGPIPGLFRLSLAGLADELGWTVETVSKPFAELFRNGMAKADWDARLVWLPNALKYNPPANPNVIKGWAKAWDELPECSLKDEAYRAFSSFLDGYSEPFRNGFETVSKPFGKPFRKQEQEQEQEQETNTRAADADAPGLIDAKPKNGKKPSAAEVDAIWQHYRAHHQRAVVTLRRGRKEYRLIERALEDFGADDVRKAIDGYHRSPWHTGTNPSGKQYLGIDLILRDASKIQAGIEMAEPRSSGGGPRTLVDYRPGAHDTNH